MEAADGWVFIACGNNKLWQQFCQGIERPDLATHASYALNADRRAHYQELMAILRPLIAARPRAHWEKAFVDAGVPFAPVHTLAELGRHPQVRASGIVQEYTSPEFGTVQTVTRAVRFNAEVAPAGNPPPSLGAHTREVLRDLGFSDDEITRLEAERAIGIA